MVLVYNSKIPTQTINYLRFDTLSVIILLHFLFGQKEVGQSGRR